MVDFTTDWFSMNIHDIRRSLQRFSEVNGDRPVTSLLEIGSWEGRSATWFLENLPSVHMTCVDTFEGGGGADYSAFHQLPEVERRFRENTAKYADRVTIRKGKSDEVLFGLEPASFDVAYVDASHHASDVLSDIVMSWNLLKPGGVMLMDDYAYNKELMDHGAPWLEVVQNCPAAAIDAFVKLNPERLEVLTSGHQYHVLKKL